jgi:GT2 family glycosyltransferase
MEHLETCFKSIFSQSYSDFKVVLVDNGSLDKSVEYTKNNFPAVEVIPLGYNSGFSKAVNAGIKYCIENHNNTYILLLNNDTELEKNFLEAAITTFDENPDAYSMAVKMVNFHDRKILDDTGNFLTRKSGTAYGRGNGKKDAGQFDKPEYIFGACAGAALYRKEVFEKIGFFDEDFFAYLEDIDFSFRAQLAGLKCYYQPKAVCYHKRGASRISTLKFQVKMNERNMVLLRFKNYPLVMYLRNQPRFFLSRIRRNYLLLRDHGYAVMISAVKGYFIGVFNWPLQIGKRIKIQSKRKVSILYLQSLMR